MLISTLTWASVKSRGNKRGSLVKVEPRTEIKSEGMKACIAKTFKNDSRPKKANIDLHTYTFTEQGLGMEVSAAPSGYAVVQAVKEGGAAAIHGVKVGDVIRWPGSGGKPAPYTEFTTCCNSRERPLRFVVARLLEQNSPNGRDGRTTRRTNIRRGTMYGSGGGSGLSLSTLAATPIIEEYEEKPPDPTELMKINRAMSSFKQIDHGLMPVRTSAIEIEHSIPSPDLNPEINCKYEK